MVRYANRSWWAGLLFIFAVMIFHVDSIQYRYMRDDEEIAFRTTRNDLSYAIWYQAMQDVHAPLWFSSFWLWQQFAGSTEFAGRVYSVLATVLTLALVYQIGRRWFQSEQIGLLAIAVLGVNAYFFTYGLEIRPYAMNMLAATVSMWCFGRWLQRKTLTTALIYGLTVTWMLYQHYFLMFLVLVQAVYVVLVMRQNRQVVLQIVGAWMFGLLLWLPWLPIAIHQIQTLVVIESQFGNARGVAGIGSTTEPTSLNSVVSLIYLVSSGQPGLYICLVFIGLVGMWRHRFYRLALMWALAVPVVALGINLLFAVYTPRYITYLTIGFGIMIAVGIRTLPRKLQWPAMAMVAGISLWSLPSQFGLSRIPYRDFYKAVAHYARPGDVMLIDQADMSNNVVLWQMSHYLPDFILNARTENIHQAKQARRIWFTTANWFDRAVQADFATLEPDYPVQRVLGDCNRYWCYLIQLMERAPFDHPIVFGAEMPFWGGDVDQVDRGAIAVRLWWRVVRPPTANYSIGLHLLDEAGTIVAQADGPIRHYATDLVESSAMQPDRFYIDFRRLELPDAITAGSYRLALVVYDWQSGERLILEDGQDRLMFGSVDIP